MSFIKYSIFILEAPDSVDGVAGSKQADKHLLCTQATTSF